MNEHTWKLEGQYYLSKARSLGDQRESEEMSSRKRIRNELDDEMSTASPSDERESEEEMSSPKRMRNESDDDMSTVSNEDIFSSSVEEDGKSSEEMSESDDSEEADPWGELIHEAAAELRAKHDVVVQNFQNDGFSEVDAKKQAFSEILPELRKELGSVYLDRPQWMSQMKRDPVHRKIMKTRDAFVDEENFDPDEALTTAIKKRKFLLERMLEDRQHFPDSADNDEDDNVYHLAH